MSILGLDGKPLDVSALVDQMPDFKKNPLAVPPITYDRSKAVFKTGPEGLSAITEKFESAAAQEWAMKAGHILRTHYRGYGWFVRAIGTVRDPTSIAIGLAELMAWGGTKTAMYLHPKDFGLTGQFEAEVKKLGGELLERARLNRHKKLDSDMLGPSQLPDGFADILPNVTKKMITCTSVEEVVAATRAHEEQMTKNQSIVHSDQNKEV